MAIAPTDQPRDAQGRWTAQAGFQKLKKMLRDNPALIHDAIVKTGAMAGSLAGHHLGGDAGAMAGQLIGTLATRQAVNLVSCAHTASQQLTHQDAFARATELDKLKQLGAATLSELRSPAVQAKLAESTEKDLMGFATAHLANHAMNSFVPGAEHVILKGGIAASAIVPKLLEAKRRMREKRG